MMTAMQSPATQIMWGLKPQNAYAKAANPNRGQGSSGRIMELLQSIGSPQSKITITIEPNEIDAELIDSILRVAG